MYRKFYGLREKPFSLTTNPKYLYLSQYHRDALAFLSDGYKKNLNLIVFTGEIGSGKTLLLKTFVKDVGPEVKLVQVFYPPHDRVQLILMILFHLGIKSEEDDIDTLREKLKNHLLKLRKEGKDVLLLIDEAQGMGEEALKETIWFSKLYADGHCLIRTILAGFPRLVERFNFLFGRKSRSPGTGTFYLKNLPADEVQKYIHHGLVIAGRTDFEIFPQEVIKEIGNFSGGIPRLINIVCDSALLHGYFANMKVITLPVIRKVFEELFLEGKPEVSVQTDLPPSVPTKPDVKQDKDKKQILQEKVKKVHPEKTVLKPDYTGSEESSVQDIRQKQDKPLPLTVLILEKNARMRIHLENKFQEQGFNLVKFLRLEDIFEILNRSIKLELQVLVADSAFFFTKGGHEEPSGKSILDKINLDYACVPLVMTSDLPLSSIRTKLFRRGIPYLLHKPDLSRLDMSEVPRQFNMFFNELKSCLENIHFQFCAFYMKFKGKNCKNPRSL